MESRRSSARAPGPIEAPTRVLHLGNIANNAFHNAELMASFGIESDVLCFDYYHVMATPEWEDCEVSDLPGGDLFPNWHRADLGSYQRPEWYVQGPLEPALHYLALKYTNPRLARAFRASVLEPSRFLWGTTDGHRVREALRSARSPGDVRALAQLVPSGLHAPVVGTLLRSKATRQARLVRRRARPYTSRLVTPKQRDDVDVDGVLDRFRSRFPDRADQLEPADLQGELGLVGLWKRVLQHYDFVIGYATAGVWPLLAGKSYYCFEHGTLRYLPFEATSLGRKLALTFAESEHAFVTNSDCVDQARVLCGDRFTTINHPWDERRADRVERDEPLRDDLRRRTKSDWLVFAPARHNWGEVNDSKANDVLVRALAVLRDRGHRVGLVTVDWGPSVAATKDLLQQLGLAEHTLWQPVLPNPKLLRMAKTCDIVADQFHLSSLSGIQFRALAAAAPVATYLDHAVISGHFPSPPPGISARTSAELADLLEPLVNDASIGARLGKEGRAWIDRHHAGRETARRQLEAMGLPLLAQHDS